MSKFYTGVGSRESPKFACKAMTSIACFLEQEGYILRSGGADGADLAFENGVTLSTNKHIYLPKKGFNKNPSKLYNVADDARALALAESIHPAWDRCTPYARLLHARNCYQVLGQNLDNPSDFLVCWTENAEKRGGTRTAIVLAEKNGVPILNLGKYDTIRRCLNAFEIFYDMYGQAA